MGGFYKHLWMLKFLLAERAFLQLPCVDNRYVEMKMKKLKKSCILFLKRNFLELNT